MPTLDYASSPDFRADVSRAQWAVVQTGLITSGLALFGVYVLATRINDLHLMSMYLWGWVPFGPMLVGLIAGSGYILASWWFGVRVGPGMVLAIIFIQFGMFMACHYADFETRDLVYRDTGERVGFGAYFDRMTRRLGERELELTEPPAWRGYAIRFAEGIAFAAGGLLSALTLVGRPKCGACGGLVRSKPLGRIGGPRVNDVIKRLEERARVRDARGFLAEIAGQANLEQNARELTITRCEVCSIGMIEQAEVAAAAAAAAAETAGPATAPAARDAASWRIDVHGEFARDLFDEKRAIEPEPHPGDSTVEDPRP